MNHRRLLLISLLLPSAAFALASDQQLPLSVQADKADINHKSGIGVYSGNVLVDQGTSHLQAASAETFTGKNNELKKAIAKGLKDQQAQFRTVTDPSKPELKATADQIEIYPTKNKIVLVGNAQVTQGTDTFSAPRIEYDTKEQHVVTTSSETGRTTIVIHPNKDKAAS
jgi:lipopolysaccharide export system protein LptA